MNVSFSPSCMQTIEGVVAPVEQRLLQGLALTLSGLLWLAAPVYAQTDWSGKTNQAGQSAGQGQTYGNYNPYGSAGNASSKQPQQQQQQQQYQQQQPQSPDWSGRASQQQTYNQPQQQRPSQTYNVQSTQSYNAPQVQSGLARTPTGPVKFFEDVGKKRLKSGEVVPNHMMPKVP